MFNKAKKFLKLYVSCCYKRDSAIWIFGGWFGEKYADNTKYLFEAVSRVPSIRAIWVSSNPAIVEYVNDLGYEAYEMRSQEAIQLQKKAKYFFTCTGFQDVAWEYSGNATLFELWHGIPLKKIMWDDVTTKRKRNKVLFRTIEFIRMLPRRKEYVVSTSKTIKEIYIKCFKKPSKNILIYGQPRNDIFFSGTSKLKEILGNGKKIVLYMPTHRNQGKTIIPCSRILNLVELNDFCKQYDLIFAIKKHFYHRDETEDFSVYSNIIDITANDFDSQELLYSADILITDYSSCYFDYLLLDRPIIFYGFDFDNYILNDRELYFDYQHVTPGAHVYSKEELLNNLKQIIHGKDGYANERKKIRDMFYDEFAQGPISMKMIEDIQNGIYD